MSMVSKSVDEAAEDGMPVQWRTVHRVVFPTDGDTDTLPLYVDFNAAQRVVSDGRPLSGTDAGVMGVVAQRTSQRSDVVLDRRSLRLPAYRRVSFGTYFNAFPASYWRAHTNVGQVRLTVDVDAEATVIIYRSSSRGTSNRVKSVYVGANNPATVDLPITAFGDGGWYWFDLVAQDNDVNLVNAEWAVPEHDGFVPGTLSIAVTTFNRPDYCVRLLQTLAEAPQLLTVLDRLLITDQGTQKVRYEEGYEDAARALEGQFHLIEQANLGGSGGFARGMHETLEDGRSKYVMLLDDDVIVETEGILRAVSFADFTRKPTIVGGHMFNLYERAVLHSFGEEISEYRYTYGTVSTTQESHDFSASNLRTTPWMHRRVDVDYNGWWMCLIPTSIIREIGLALPVFIKWDDAEYGIRAKAHGYRTVSLPGAAVWHMPWTEKDDTIDWQAYYHQRNRWLATMLYSPYKHGGRMPRESFAVDVRHLLSMQYSAVELRLNALEDILDGPSHLHATIGAKLPEIRRRRAEFDDARIEKNIAEFPDVKRVKPPKKGVKPSPPHTLRSALVKAGTGALRQVRAARPEASVHPEANVPAMDARWWRLSQLDSALVSSADGSGASWYKRDSAKFQSMLKRSIVLHQRLLARWDELTEEYQQALPDFTSQQAWVETFEDASSVESAGKSSQ
ncbi:glycosyltransferase [Arthrobacter sp. TMS1-12-1]